MTSRTVIHWAWTQIENRVGRETAGGACDNLFLLLNYFTEMLKFFLCLFVMDPRFFGSQNLDWEIYKARTLSLFFSLMKGFPACTIPTPHPPIECPFPSPFPAPPTSHTHSHRTVFLFCCLQLFVIASLCCFISLKWERSLFPVFSPVIERRNLCFSTHLPEQSLVLFSYLWYPR